MLGSITTALAVLADAEFWGKKKGGITIIFRSPPKKTNTRRREPEGRPFHLNRRSRQLNTRCFDLDARLPNFDA